MKKKAKQAPKTKPLTPPQYIKQRARLLPLGDCWINSDWKETGMAQIFVTRMHTTGNVTFGVYLFDLFAMGLKDTFFNFNKSQSEFAELINRARTNLPMVVIPYPYVHNIIYRGIEFAKETGFKANADFDLTKFILEEDNDAIERIDIDFGLNGKPTIITGFED